LGQGEVIRGFPYSFWVGIDISRWRNDAEAVGLKSSSLSAGEIEISAGVGGVAGIERERTVLEG